MNSLRAMQLDQCLKTVKVVISLTQANLKQLPDDEPQANTQALAALLAAQAQLMQAIAALEYAARRHNQL
jgi:uncharacterized membrane protein